MWFCSLTCETQVEQSKCQSDQKATLQELAAVQARLQSLQTEKNLLTGAQGDVEKKYQDLVEKFSELSKEHQNLVTANKDLVQVNFYMPACLETQSNLGYCLFPCLILSHFEKFLRRHNQASNC